MTKIPISKITGKPLQKRGFAAMDAAKRKAIARKGGAAVPAEKRAFHKNRKLAAEAGAKGGTISTGRRRQAVPA